MKIGKTSKLPDSTAKIISVVFHPLLIPLYGMIIIFSSPTLFGYLPFNVKKILFLIVLIDNVLLPLSLMPYYKFRNIISTWSIEDRKERYIPLIVTSIFYSVTSIIVFRFQIPLFLKSFIFSASFVALMVTLINFLSKISIHSSGAGVLVALVLILALKTNYPLTWYLVSVIITGGLILSSRLRLNSHNPQQVWFGFLVGFLGFGISMLFI